MKILIKFPTRNRKEVFFNTFHKYYGSLDDLNNVNFVLTFDNDDESMNNDEVRKTLDKYKNVKYYFGNSKTKIEAINNDIYNLDFDILLLASDDMVPQVKGFDTIIRNDMEKYYPNKDGILWYYDGFNKSVNTICIMGVEYYKKNNYIYNPIYRSFYCDTEQTILAQKLNKITFIDNTIIKHLHPDNTDELHASYDATYTENNDYGYDQQIFVQRMREVMNVNLDHL